MAGNLSGIRWIAIYQSWCEYEYILSRLHINNQEDLWLPLTQSKDFFATQRCTQRRISPKSARHPNITSKNLPDTFLSGCGKTFLVWHDKKTSRSLWWNILCMLGPWFTTSLLRSVALTGSPVLGLGWSLDKHQGTSLFSGNFCDPRICALIAWITPLPASDWPLDLWLRQARPKPGLYRLGYIQSLAI